VALGRIALAWAAVAAWLLAWMAVERRLARSGTRPRRREGWPESWWVAGEALLLTLFAALWFGSLGAGTAWLVFLLLGALREWPVRSVSGAARVGRVMVAGAILSRILAP
jgi:hypothetical protein